MRHVTTLLLCLAAGTGCVTIGNRIDWAALDTLRPGVTTLPQAEKALGPATSKAVDATGTTTAVWIYSRGTWTGSMQANSLRLTFTPAGHLVALPPRVTHP